MQSQDLALIKRIDSNINTYSSYVFLSENCPLVSAYEANNTKIDLNKFIKKDNKNIGEKLINLFKRSYKRQYGDFQFDLVLDFLSNDFEQSLLFAHSGLKNAIVIDKNTKTKAYTQFSEIYEISEVNLKEIIYGENK